MMTDDDDVFIPASQFMVVDIIHNFIDLSNFLLGRNNIHVWPAPDG